MEREGDEEEGPGGRRRSFPLGEGEEGKIRKGKGRKRGGHVGKEVISIGRGKGGKERKGKGRKRRDHVGEGGHFYRERKRRGRGGEEKEREGKEEEGTCGGRRSFP